jgi:hypothetical protein
MSGYTDADCFSRLLTTCVDDLLALLVKYILARFLVVVYRRLGGSLAAAATH